MRTVLVTKASTLVKLKFYFPRVGGSRELGLGAKSPCHQGFNPGGIRFLFSKGGGGWGGDTSLALVRKALVTKASTLVKSYQGWVGHANLALVRRVLVTKASTLVRLKFYFQKGASHVILAFVQKVLVTPSSAQVKFRYYFLKGRGRGHVSLALVRKVLVFSPGEI